MFDNYTKHTYIHSHTHRYKHLHTHSYAHIYSHSITHSHTQKLLALQWGEFGETATQEKQMLKNTFHGYTTFLFLLLGLLTCGALGLFCFCFCFVLLFAPGSEHRAA